MRFVLRWWIVIAVPVVLTMGLVRLVTMPWYARWEYSRPGFPPDVWGMSTSDRLLLAKACIRFLNRPASIGALESLQLPDGTPAFNDRELRHMVDVKQVYGQLTAIAAFFLAVAITSAWALARRGHIAMLWAALSDGGLLTLLLLLALGIWMLIGFEVFFTAFHSVFFVGDTWLFADSDTLIRLFPLRFWQDAGLLIAVTVSSTSLVLALLGRALQKRADRDAPKAS